MLAAPIAMATRILEIEHALKSSWVGEVGPKWSYYEQVPHKVCCAFAPCFGYTLADSKQRVREAFQEFTSSRKRTKATCST